MATVAPNYGKAAPLFRASAPAVASGVATAVRRQASQGDLATLAAIGTLGLEFFFAYPAVILRMLLVGALTLRARATSLPAILICQLYASDFQLAGLQTYEYLLDRHEASRVTILGFPITTNYVFAFCLTISVLAHFANRPQLFKGIVSRTLILLWCSCFPIAVIAALASYADKAVSWSAPVRDAMMVGCFFYGLVIAEDRAATRRVITHRLMPMFAVLLLLALFGYFYSRGMYWITAAGPAMLIGSLLVRGSGMSPWFAGGYFALTMAYVFAWYPTGFAHQVAKALYSETATTFALKGMWLGSAALMPIAIGYYLRRTWPTRSSPARLPTGVPRRTTSAVASAILMIAFPLGVAYASYHVQVEFSSKKYNADLPWNERLLYKLLFDRAPIYRGAIDELVHPPFFFKAGQRQSYAMTLAGDKYIWPAGSHNLVLEELRRNGWYSGLVCLGVIVSAMMWACTALFRTRDPFVLWYSAATFVTLLISGLTSHIPMETNASIWMLTPAGVCAALIRSEYSGQTSRQ